MKFGPEFKRAKIHEITRQVYNLLQELTEHLLGFSTGLKRKLKRKFCVLFQLHPNENKLNDTQKKIKKKKFSNKRGGTKGK